MNNIGEMLNSSADLYAEKPALSYEGHEISFAQLLQFSLKIAHELDRIGINKNEKVGIFAPHSPALVSALFGVSLIGGVFVIINPLLKSNQIRHILSDADVSAILGTEEYLKAIQDDIQDRMIQPMVVDLQGELVGADIDPADTESAQLPRLDRIIPKDVSNIIYTSGSTGRAKGVVVPHRTLLDGARIVSGYLEISPSDRILSILPFNFDYGLNQLMSTIFTGACLAMHNYALPQDFIRTIIKEKVTGLAGVPSLWPHILNPRLVKVDEGETFPHLRYITTAGGVHSQDLLKSLTQRFPETEIIIMYGLTESFRTSYLPFSELFKRPGSIGKPVPEVEVFVMNGEGRKCDVGEKGELIHRGAFVTYGYLNSPDLTESKFINLQTGGQGCRSEIAVRSGDIVSYDSDGYLYYHGRADMQIKCSGYRISPSEVEEIVLTYSDISHAAVFGMPDPHTGESVNLAYSTYSGDPVDQKNLIHHISEMIPSYAVTRHIKHYKKMPLTPNGKIDYPKLKENVKTG